MPAPLPLQKLTEEQKKLIEDNMDFVYWWFHKNEIYDEDPQQDYWYAICKHIHLFDPEVSSIATFIRVILESKRSSIRKRDNGKNNKFNDNAVKLEALVYNDDGTELTWNELIGNEDEGYEKVEDRDFYNKFMEDLCNNNSITKSQFNYFVAYINLGNYSDVARLYGTTRQAVQQAIKRVKDRLSINEKKTNKYLGE